MIINMAMNSANRSPFHGDDTNMEALEEEPVELSRWQAFKQRLRHVGRSIKGLDDRVNRSTFGRAFRLTGSGHVSVDF